MLKKGAIALQKIKDLLNRNLIFWLAARFLVSRRSLFGGSALFSFLGLSLGVAVLYVAMSIFSGFENTLKNSVADVSGHIQVVKRSQVQDDWLDLEVRLKKLDPDIQAATRFVFVEAITAKKGQLSGILIQGVDEKYYEKVLNYQSRVISGEMNLGKNSGGVSRAVIGKRLAEKMDLKVGEIMRIIVPVTSLSDPKVFERKLGSFEVAGILDLGKFDWNEKVVITGLAAIQDAADLGQRYSGLFLKHKDIDQASATALKLTQELGSLYWVRDWRESNENLFNAVEYERPVVFFVVLIIVIVAAFNISSTLFVNVMRRYSDIAILKTLGMRRRDLLILFSLQGVIIGILAFILGLIFGEGLVTVLMFLQRQFELIPGSVYHIDGIQAKIRFVDLFVIFITTTVICIIATLAPARKGADLKPVEGLRYDS